MGDVRWTGNSGWEFGGKAAETARLRLPQKMRPKRGAILNKMPINA
jgi:hypothetical protein